MGDRKHLTAALAAAGITGQDWQDIEKARRIVDKVNARLAARDAALLFCLIPAAAHGPCGRWGSPEILETD